MNNFKKALVAVVIGFAAIGCSELSEDTVSADTSSPAVPTSPAPVDPDPVDPPTIDPSVEIVYDLTYVCLKDGHEMDYVATDGKYNVYEPLTMNLLHTGPLGNMSYNKRLVGMEEYCPIIDPMPVVCEEGEYLNGGVCEELPTITVDPTITGTNKTPAEPFGFTVTPGLSKVDVAFDAATDNMTNYYVRDYAEGSYSASSTFVKYKTSFTYLRSNCSVREYQLVAKYADGSSVETSRIAAKPSNCE